MKVAFYMEDGLEQIVFTPVNESEQNMLNRMHDENRTVEIKRGSFYDTQGGWKRHGVYYGTSDYGAASDYDDKSTMVVLRPKPPTLAEEQLKNQSVE